MTTLYFDLETAGLEMHHPVIQLAAVAVDETTWKELATFNHKVAFNELLADPQALAINHYSPDKWQNALAPKLVLEEFQAFVQPFCQITMISKRSGRPYQVARLAAHNAAFDGPRLIQMGKTHHIFLPIDLRVKCTMQRAIWYFDQLEPRFWPSNFQLETLCQRLELKSESPEFHDALADVRWSIQLSRALAQLEAK